MTPVTHKPIHLALFALSLTTLLGACHPRGARGPEGGSPESYGGFPGIKNEGTPLTVGDDLTLPKRSDSAPPLEVIYYGPEGSRRYVNAIAVTFNQPLYALGTESRPDALEKLFTITPEVKGQLVFLNGDTIKIELDNHLKWGNHYVITLKKGITAVSGRKLEKDLVWHIDTPAPHVTSIDHKTNHAATHTTIHPDDYFIVHFSDAIDFDHIKKFISLKAKGRDWPTETAPVKGSDKQVRVWSHKPFPHDSNVGLYVKRGYRLKSGPVKAPKTYSNGFKVHPGKLTCELKLDPYVKKYKIYVNPLTPKLKIICNQSVDRDLLATKVRFRPGVGKIRFDSDDYYYHRCNYRKESHKGVCNTTFEVTNNLTPNSTYTITLDKGLKDLHGHTLGQSHDLEITTGGYPPGLFLPNDADALR